MATVPATNGANWRNPPRGRLKNYLTNTNLIKANSKDRNYGEMNSFHQWRSLFLFLLDDDDDEEDDNVKQPAPGWSSSLDDDGVTPCEGDGAIEMLTTITSGVSRNK